MHKLVCRSEGYIESLGELQAQYKELSEALGLGRSISRHAYLLLDQARRRPIEAGWGVQAAAVGFRRALRQLAYASSQLAQDSP